MGYQVSAQAYYRSASDSVYKKQLSRQKVLDVHGVLQIVSCAGKNILYFLPVVFVLNLCMAFCQDRIETSAKMVEQSRYELMNEHIALRAKNARLMSPEYIQVAAAEKLSLHTAQKGQVKHF